MKSSNRDHRTDVKEIRKPYQKPVVERVQLIIDEAILGTGCKTAASAGSNQNVCIVSLTNCFDPGS